MSACLRFNLSGQVISSPRTALHKLRVFSHTANKASFTIRTLVTGIELKNSEPSQRPIIPQKVLLTALAGTVPLHKSYTLIHHPLAPSSSSFPSRPDKSFSTLYQSLLVRATRHGGLINFCWTADDQPDSQYSTMVERDVSPEEFYHATIFISGEKGLARRIDVPELSLEYLSEYDSLLENASSPRFLSAQPDSSHEVHIYVCTHGTRDCRCGDKGPALIQALKTEIQVRKSASSVDNRKEGFWDRIKIGEIAHVGGHKYAANALIFPSGDWLGQITSDQAPLLIDVAAIQLTSNGKDLVNLSQELRLFNITHEDSKISPEDLFPKYLPSHWRGRMGMNKEEQKELVASYT